MELFFPLIGVAALGIAALAASCCILIPSREHLVSKVFFGTFAFFFGGAVLTFIIFVAFALSANAMASAFRVPNTFGRVLLASAYLITGTCSALATIRLVDHLFKAFGSGLFRNKEVSSVSAEDHRPLR